MSRGRQRRIGVQMNLALRTPAVLWQEVHLRFCWTAGTASHSRVTCQPERSAGQSRTHSENAWFRFKEGLCVKVCTPSIGRYTEYRVTPHKQPVLVKIK